MRTVPALLLAACSFRGGLQDAGGRDGNPGGGDAMRDATGIDGDPGAWAPWSNKRRLDIDNTGLGAHAGFPLLVMLDGTRITYGKTKAAGADLRFSDAAGNALPYEIERWDPAGASFVWVRVPAIAANATTVVWMYYGSAAATDAQQATAVWDDDYVGVWHLVDHRDSTNNLASVNHGTTPLAAGHIGGAANLSGNAQYIDTGTNEYLARWTLEVWMRPNANPSSAGPSGPINRYPNYQIQWNCTDPNYCRTATFANSVGTIYDVHYDAALANTWSHVVARYDGTALESYVDASLAQSSATSANPSTTSIRATIGARLDANRYFAGAIDEVRISRIARSNDYIRAQHRSTTDAYLAYGDELPNP